VHRLGVDSDDPASLEPERVATRLAIRYRVGGRLPFRAPQAFASGWSWDAESAPETRWDRLPHNDASTDTPNVLNSPAPGRWPQWEHQRGSAHPRRDGAVAGLQVGLPGYRPDLDRLHDDLFSMSWHMSRLTWLASPLAYGVFLACLARCVTWPRSVWWLPLTLRPLVSNALLSVRASHPSPDALCVFRRELEDL
jgi:hypothetical protein